MPLERTHKEIYNLWSYEFLAYAHICFSARHRGSTGLLYPLNSVGTHCCVLDVNFRITSSIWLQNYEEFSYYQKFFLIITKKGMS